MPFSFITLFNQRSNKIIITAAAMANPKFIKKKFFLSAKPSHIPESIPDNLLPMDVLKKNPPIISAVIRGGLSLETKDSPIGERHSSPKVITP